MNGRETSESHELEQRCLIVLLRPSSLAKYKILSLKEFSLQMSKAFPLVFSILVAYDVWSHSSHPLAEACFIPSEPFKDYLSVSSFL